MMDIVTSVTISDKSKLLKISSRKLTHFSGAFNILLIQLSFLAHSIEPVFWTHPK